MASSAGGPLGHLRVLLVIGTNRLSRSSIGGGAHVRSGQARTKRLLIDGRIRLCKAVRATLIIASLALEKMPPLVFRVPRQKLR